MARLASAREEDVIGAKVLEVPIWGPIIVQSEDGTIYEIHTVEGHSGPENEIERRY